MTVTSLFASRQHKTSAAMDGLCQIVLNQNLSRQLKKWCKFSSHVKAYLHKVSMRKTIPTHSTKYD